MKATIIPIDPQPKPFAIRLEFDSEKQYALFRRLFTTVCIASALRGLGDAELAEIWKVLPERESSHDTVEITNAIRAALAR